jgi:hypothetical protein
MSQSSANSFISNYPSIECERAVERKSEPKRLPIAEMAGEF